MNDPYDLERFTTAQRPIFDQVLGELRSGRKRTHWMWFVFPQFRGLGASAMATRYAIRSLEEADAYLRHDVLGPRLLQCTQLVNDVEGRSILQIFGQPDDMKFRSCVTLFSLATVRNEVFLASLHKYFDGKPDTATIGLLGGDQLFNPP